jgi:hypothetical protein
MEANIAEAKLTIVLVNDQQLLIQQKLQNRLKYVLMFAYK